MDPIFDLATDLRQGEDILPHPYSIRAGEVKQGISAGKEAMSDPKRPMEESKTMNIFFSNKFFQKSPRLAA